MKSKSHIWKKWTVYFNFMVLKTLYYSIGKKVSFKYWYCRLSTDISGVDLPLGLWTGMQEPFFLSHSSDTVLNKSDCRWCSHSTSTEQCENMCKSADKHHSNIMWLFWGRTLVVSSKNGQAWTVHWSDLKKIVFEKLNTGQTNEPVWKTDCTYPEQE